ncbi:hypothetical protein EVAR_87495_1 [Eumeta japonica]|uniref:Uncharacterized protein n=1 Tax=Eumeta variegata TaxID=151549 RepID=A0A4C1VX34_EUMVA|nr:hypothetical protein EVAR_87495_1 [Eumeta japonica]
MRLVCYETSDLPVPQQACTSSEGSIEFSQHPDSDGSSSNSDFDSFDYPRLLNQDVLNDCIRNSSFPIKRKKSLDKRNEDIVLP